VQSSVKSKYRLAPFFLRGDSSHRRDADSVRTELVRDGFPTDRVELTASRERGRAITVPRSSRDARW